VERRAANRHTVHVETVVTNTGLKAGALGRNIGSGGMRLTFAPDLLPVVGEVYEVEFTIPGCPAPTTNRVIVRWVDAIRMNECGVQFLDGLRASEMQAVVQLPKERD